jgi:hypothetical protein
MKKFKRINNNSYSFQLFKALKVKQNYSINNFIQCQSKQLIGNYLIIVLDKMGVVCSCCSCCNCGWYDCCGYSWYCCFCGKSKVTPSSAPDRYKPIVSSRSESSKLESSRKGSESEAMHRFSKVNITEKDPRRRMYGFEKEPLVSLEEALKPFDGKIVNLYADIREAKEKCKRSSKHGLTVDESAAIYIYTMKWEPECVYDHLQNALSSGKRYGLKPWFKYLKLLKTALDKLPDVETETWQGTVIDKDDKDHRNLQEKLHSESLYCSLMSCSQTNNKIKDYLDNKSDKQKVLIGYKTVHGKLVTDYTANNLNKIIGSKTEEVIVWPGMKLGVAGPIVNSSGLSVYHLTGQVGKYHRCRACPLCLWSC